MNYKQESTKPMPFISYAQNYEDVMLYRALKNVEKGIYVDVGANDPINESVTKAFYERGWRGINIDPIRHCYDKLMVDRPEDLNLNAAISDQPGLLHFYDVQGTGLSTSNKDFAEDHLRELGFQYQEIIVPALTLDSVLQRYNHEIHFLKVDVEGAEKQVLASIDLTHTRPWIILVEATKPFSQEQNHEEWEFLLINRGYLFVYFDGLNRFYIAKERSDLSAAFSSPPNFFDNFIRVSEWNAQISLKNNEKKREQLKTALNNKEAERLQLEIALKDKEVERLQLEIAVKDKEVERLQLETVLRTSQERVKNLETNTINQKNEIQHWIDEVNRHQVEIKSIYGSTSWRVTAPLRKVSDFGRGIRHTVGRLFPLSTLPKRVILKIIRSISLWIIVRPNVDRVVIAVVNHFPAVKNRLKKIVYVTLQPTNHVAVEIEEHMPMSPEVKSIYMDLVNKINNNEQVNN